MNYPTVAIRGRTIVIFDQIVLAGTSGKNHAYRHAAARLGMDDIGIAHQFSITMFSNIQLVFGDSPGLPVVA